MDSSRVVVRGIEVSSTAVGSLVTIPLPAAVAPDISFTGLVRGAGGGGVAPESPESRGLLDVEVAS